jgi:gliding motility-associated protein GldC
MTSDIVLKIKLDEQRMPDEIQWTAADGGVVDPQSAKAFMLGLWDGAEKTAVRIDLWTQKMEINEMNDFFFQTFYGMADTFVRATGNKVLADELRAFAKDFLKKASESQSPQP